MEMSHLYSFHFQPGAVRFSFFDTGKDKSYVDSDKAQLRFDKFKEGQFKPWLNALETQTKCAVTCEFSGSFLTYLKQDSTVLAQVKKLVQNGKIELIACPFAHSLSSLFSKAIFMKEVAMHQNLIAKLFDVKKAGFRNTATIFSNEIVDTIKERKFEYVYAPKVEWFIPGNSTTCFFQSVKPIIPLAVMENTQSQNTNPVEFITITDGCSDDFAKVLDMPESSITVSSMLAKETLEYSYSLPDLVGMDNFGRGLNDLLGNTLQKDLLKRLKELSPLIAHTNDNNILQSFLWIGSEQHFQLISNRSKQEIRYPTYVILQNMLYDIELKLR